MAELSGFPYFEIQFTKNGSIFDDQEENVLKDFLGHNPVSDLIVISHGWNSELDEARRDYRAFFERLREILDDSNLPGIKTRQYAALGVLWPSKKFAPLEAIAGHGQGLDSVVTEEFLEKQLEELKEVFNSDEDIDKLDKAKSKIPLLMGEDDDGIREFADILRSLLVENEKDKEDNPSQLFTKPGNQLMNSLREPALLSIQEAASGGESLGDVVTMFENKAQDLFGVTITGTAAAANKLINFITYYEMKERSETVGRNGVNQVLRTLPNQPLEEKLKIHLVGHSFGGRLVTSVAAGPEGQPAVIFNSMTLLQAAFSHYGFAFDEKKEDKKTFEGYFRKVIADKLVTGPVLITYTENDKVVGVAYAIASLAANQVASSLGDKNDPYGGLGRNGAQKTPEALEKVLEKVGFDYKFVSGKIYNLKSDNIIKDHGDVFHNEVAHAVLSAISKT